MVDQGFVLNGCHDGHDWAIIELEEPYVTVVFLVYLLIYLIIG